MPSVSVTAPSRLHFGLLSFGRPGVRQFGGAGVMVERPGLRLRITPNNSFQVIGPLRERVRTIAERYRRFWELSALPGCTVEVVSAPPEHVGLGTGTQLTLAVVAGLDRFRAVEPLDVVELAHLAGRAARSAVGTYGFAQGGLLIEPGKLDCEPVAPLEHRIDLPDAWRIALVIPAQQRGLSGDAERAAFGNLPAVSAETTAALVAELAEELIPAATEGQFERFSESLYRYGHAAGMCFAARQGGPFASPRVAMLVETIRSLGIRGVGQSSWGPTVFAVLPNEAAADDLLARLAPHLVDEDQALVTPVCRSGARIENAD